MPYDQMHLFIDETGTFNEIDGKKIIGGVLLFGNYGQIENATLQGFFDSCLNQFHGNFPSDLHLGKNNWPPDTKKAFLQSFHNQMKENNDLFNRTFGVSITYEDDILIDDTKHDNRYENMLLFLIQHLLFVSQNVAERSMPRAKIYITIASRVFVFERNDYNVETYAQLGWENWRIDRENFTKGFVQSVNDDIIRTLINPNNGGSKRWPSDQIEVMNIQLNSLDYNSGTSPKGLYLADLLLGAIRSNTRLLTSICNIQYSPKLRFLHEMHSSLSNNDLAGYLENNNRLYESISKTNQPNEIILLIQNLEVKAVILANAKQNYMTISNYLLDSCILVDQPVNTNEGFRRIELVEKLLGERIKDVSKDTALILQTKLSFYNHKADLTNANNIWDKFLKIENSLPALGPEGIKFTIEIRNRWAVSLSDRFYYSEAEKVLLKIVSIAERLRDAHAIAYKSIVEDLRAAHAIAYKCKLTDIPDAKLGATYGTFGQVYAFQGNKEDAEINFREAISLFSDSKDIERQWVYLGHLACDIGKANGMKLWSEVSPNLAGINDNQLIIGDGCQFTLALQLKGKFVFGTNGQIIEFANNFLNNNHPLNNLPRNPHPYGLIMQMAGLICARAWKETNVEKYYIRAIDFFRSATERLTQGELLLKLLANVCTLRKLLLEFQKTGVNNNNQINSVINEFITHAKEIGEHAWSEDASGRTNGYFGAQVSSQNQSTIKRAQKIVDLIRFNYW